MVIEFFSNEMLLVKLNAEVDSLLAEKHFVRGYPTLLMIDKDGVEVDRLVGYADAPEFVETFRNYAKGIGTLDDLVHRADTATSDDPALFFQIADKYKYRGQGDQAIVWYQRIIDTGEPLDSLTGEARIALADALRSAEQYDQSIAAFRKIAADFKGGPIGQDAEIWTAIAYRDKGDTTQSVKEFETFIKNYPEHDAVGYCKGQISKLTGVPLAEEEK
ncbi:MAG: tetratricopeptide repeat protein [bacterium]